MPVGIRSPPDVRGAGRRPLPLLPALNGAQPERRRPGSVEARAGDVCVALSPGLPCGTPALLHLGAEPPRQLPARPDQARRVWSALGALLSPARKPSGLAARSRRRRGRPGSGRASRARAGSRASWKSGAGAPHRVPRLHPSPSLRKLSRGCGRLGARSPSGVPG